MNRRVSFARSPILSRRLPSWRSTLVVFVMASAFFALLTRAVWVQLIHHDFYERQGEVRFARTLELPAVRGRILDRNGRILASSTLAKGIWAIPQEAVLSPSNYADLAKLLKLPVPELQKRLSNADKSFVWVKRQVDVDVAREVAALKIKGLYFRDEYKRVYPEGEYSSNIVGFTDVEDKGQEGIELEFDTALRGRQGARHVIKDRLGHVVEEIDNQIKPIDGRDITLSLDSKIQYMASQALVSAIATNKAQAGSVVVLDSHTGEVLALANYPNYDPDNRTSLTGAQLRNRALTDAFELGSIMKPITMATALELGRVRPNETVNTAPGHLTFNGATISDVSNNGVLTMEGVIEKSSNIGMTKISQRLEAREMWQTFIALGFGQKPQIEFPGATTGKVRNWKSWHPIEQATMAYGYGLSSSLLQVARAYTSFANDGRVLPVTLLASKVPPPAVPVFSSKTASEIRHMLWMAAGGAHLNSKAQPSDFVVGGKSGTTRKQIGSKYVAGKFRSWFAGIAPLDNPRIVIAVMVDEPSAGAYYGGAVAAPVFSQIAEQALRIMDVPPSRGR